MTPRLPAVLTSGDLPVAELSAARLDGELYCIGSAFAPVDEIEQPRHRAAALAPGTHERLIAEQLSAAWVWGAITSPPLHQQFCTTIGARVSRTSVPWMTVREVVIDASELLQLGDMLVTSPLRTAVDIARFLPRFGANEARVIRELMRRGGFCLEDCLDLMEVRRNLPNKRLAASRLARVDSIDVVDGIDAAHGVEHAIEVGSIPHLEHKAAESQSLARRRHRRREDVDVVLAQHACDIG